MLLCIFYDHYNQKDVTTINELRKNTLFTSGSLTFVGTLDQLAASCGFVCFRCKEDCTNEQDKGRDRCWVFEIKKDVNEFTKIMAILFEAKMHSVRMAPTSRALIEQSRAMCDLCRKLERPLVADAIPPPEAAPTPIFETAEVKPVITRFIPRIEVESRSDDASTMPVFLPNLPTMQVDQVPQVGRHEELTTTVETPPALDIKPPVLKPNLNVAHNMGPPPRSGVVFEPLGDLLDRLQNQMTDTQDENDPVGAANSGRAQNTQSPVQKTGFMAIKAEAIEESSPLHSKTNKRKSAPGGSAETDLANATNVTTTSAAPSVAEKRIKISCSQVNVNTAEEASSSTSNCCSNEVPTTSGTSNTLVSVPKAPATPNGTEKLATLAAIMNRRLSEEPCTTSNQPEPRQNVAIAAVDKIKVSSSMLDIKNGILPSLELDSRQRASHFDAIAARASLPNMATIRSPMAAPAVNTAIAFIPPGHIHFSSPSSIQIPVLPEHHSIWNVNHNSNYRKFDVKSLTRDSIILFHSSILKRKNEEWVKIRMLDVKGDRKHDDLFLQFQHEAHKKPGTYTRIQKVRLCCPTLLNFILIHESHLVPKEQVNQ